MAGEVSVTPDPRSGAWRVFLLVSAVLMAVKGPARTIRFRPSAYASRSRARP